MALLGVLCTGCTALTLDSTLTGQDSPAVERMPSANDALPAGDASATQEPSTESAEETAFAGELPPDASPLAVPALPGRELFTFAAGEPGWYSVDDSVMGGISNSTVVVVEPDVLHFSGTMSLENNGGFSSARSDWQRMDLSDADGILLRVLGDGNSYRLRIHTETTSRNIAYNAIFETTPGTWQLAYVPFRDMIPTRFGYVMDVGPLDQATVGSFGVMLSDNQPGEFELYVDWLRAVSEEELARLDY